MKQTIKRSLQNYILIAFFVLAYLTFKTIAFTTSSEQPLNKISNLMMFGCSAILIGIWGVNCYRRILYRPIRSYILWSAVSMLLFMFFHTLRRTAVKGLAFYDSFSWYLYYIPMLTIPLLALMASQYLGKPENYTLKPIQYIWMIPAFILLVLVLTNNHHQLIFRLADDWVITGDYSRGLMYYFIPTWIILLILLTFHNIYRSGKPLFAGRFLPLPYILLMIGILYTILYILSEPFRRFVHLAPTYCVTAAVIIDTLMYYGLIPTNSDFEWGFRQSGMDMQILDHEGAIRYSSGSSHILSKEEMDQLIKEGTLITENEQELHLQDIPGGYAYYAHDIHDIHSIMKQTSQTNRELIDTNQNLRENIQFAEKRWHLEQGNHLFNSCFTDTLPMLSRIDHLLADTDGLSTELLRRRLGLINIYGAYIKRRSNLVILNDQHTEHAGGELVLCLQESIRNLRLYGIQTSFSLKELHHMNIEETILIYDLFQMLLDTYLESIWYLYILLTENRNARICTFQLRLDRELPETDLISIEQWKRFTLSALHGQLRTEADEEGITVSIQFEVSDNETEGGAAYDHLS